MFVKFITYWWPVLVTFVVIIMQAHVSLKWQLWRSFGITILFTIFTFYVASFFNLVFILVITCIVFWVLSAAVYYQR